MSLASRINRLYQFYASQETPPFANGVAGPRAVDTPQIVFGGGVRRKAPRRRGARKPISREKLYQLRALGMR